MKLASILSLSIWLVLGVATVGGNARALPTEIDTPRPTLRVRANSTIADTCADVSGLLEHLKNTEGSVFFCQQYLKLDSVTTTTYETRYTLDIHETTIILGGSSVEVTPAPLTNHVTVTSTSMITEFVTATATTTVTNIVGTVTSSEGLPLRQRVKHRRQSVPELSILAEDPTIMASAPNDLSLACSCLKVPNPTATATINNWTTSVRIHTSTVQLPGKTKTLPAPNVGAGTIIEVRTKTVTVPASVTVTKTVDATQTNTLPTQCFDRNMVGWDQAIPMRTTNRVEQGNIPFEECCYKCWNTQDCLYISYENGPSMCYMYMSVYDTTDVPDLFFAKGSDACPQGVSIAGRMLDVGEGLFGNHLGPCMRQATPCTACRFGPRPEA